MPARVLHILDSKITKGGSVLPKDELQVHDRCLQIAAYIVETSATVRRAAIRFGVSKSTVHKDVTERLYHVNLPLHRQVKEILEQNKAQRHLRGGEATKRKYQKNNA
jgi:putative DeoR family transcriptional regulator (stage III sporulation protein D)